MSTLFEFTRRLLGLHNGILATNDGECGGHSMGSGYGDGYGMYYGDRGGQNPTDSYRLSSSSIYGDGDNYGNGTGDGYSLHSAGLS